MTGWKPIPRTTGLGESGDPGRECRVSIDQDRLLRAKKRAVEHLLSQRNAAGHWVGELSTSALSTATAVMALHQFSSHRIAGVNQPSRPIVRSLIEGGAGWLMANQNPDGGWGDTSKSFSNISTTMLCHATLVATRSIGADASFTTLSQNTLVSRDEVIARGAAYIEMAGGIPALIARYGKDKTFSVPILTHCALAGLVPWTKVPRLPFELSCIPARWYAAAKFPVVSYALPALIAIGQVRHFHGKTWNPITRSLRWLARDRSLKVLERIQPPHGGFLEAAPLTSFVCMSLAAMGLTDHPVVQRGTDFLVKSVRPDGSWPIDTNLATWVTTLAVNALGDDLPEESRPPILQWLLDQQYQITHPYTNAAPGGWAWTDLPGGVPDADDTPGAILAVQRLVRDQRASDVSRGCSRSVVRNETTESSGPLTPTLSPTVESHPNSESIVGERGQNSEFVHEGHVVPSSRLGGSLALPVNVEVEVATEHGVRWLLGLQNRDGGFPTFCRGWGTLPFDRSSPDITAHCIRAINAWLQPPKPEDDLDFMWACGLDDLQHQALEAIRRGEAFLSKVRHPNGSWLPLWFGNQHVPNDENPVYGTSRVLRAFSDLAVNDPDIWPIYAQRGADWLYSVQNPDGGWGGDAGAPSTVEETALALDALLDAPVEVADKNVCSTQPPSPSCEDRGKPELPTLNPQPSTLNDPSNAALARGVEWLIQRVEDGTWTTPSPIGFYFAKLWYYESLYPVVWTVAALRKAASMS